jgi:hypothetical protein
MQELDGTDVQSADPLFIVVGAKRQQAYESNRAKAQLLAQVRALSIRYNPRNVGINWQESGFEDWRIVRWKQMELLAYPQ